MGIACFTWVRSQVWDKLASWDKSLPYDAHQFAKQTLNLESLWHACGPLADLLANFELRQDALLVEGYVP